VEETSVKTLPPIQVISEVAPDVIGLIVEGHIAQAMGKKLPSHYVFEHSADTPGAYICRNDEREEILIFGKNPAKLRNQFARDVNHLNPETLFAKLRYSAVAGREWTLGIESVPSDLLQSCAEFAKIMPRATKRSHKFSVDIGVDRSNLIVGTVHGVTDIETEESVIEIKHTSSSADVAAEKRQAIAYGELCGKQAVLYRSLAGEVCEVSTSQDMRRIVRACLAAKQAMSRQHNVVRRCSVTDWSSILVAVDIETHVEKQSLILEIGAVAFAPINGKIYGVYHSLSPGVETIITDANTDGSMPEHYGFDSIRTNCNTVAMHQNKLKTDLKGWLSMWGAADICHYGGNDVTTLGLKGRVSRDVSMLFRRWLGDNSLDDRKYGLEGAVDRFFGDNIYAPHRAFEDAVAAMMIVLVLSKFGDS
jgi:hypothetical protein